MHKSLPLSYASVTATCAALTEAGDTPTVRKLHAKLGGSFSTLSAFLKQWLEQQQNLNTDGNTAISAELTQAWLTELAKVIAKTKVTATAQLQTQATQLLEAQELLTEHETKIEALTQQLAVAHSHAIQLSTKFEQALAVAEARASDYVARETTLQQQLAKALEQFHAADMRAAVAEAIAAERSQ